jgi:uncharacterized integral membrane protein
MSAKLIAIIVLLILLLIFAIQNTQPVVLNFLFWQISTSSILSILVSFVIGLLTGCLLMLTGKLKKKRPPSRPSGAYSVLGRPGEEGEKPKE